MIRIVKYIALTCLILSAFASTSWSDISLEVEANRPRVYLGESFILQVRINGADQPVMPDISGITNATVRLLDNREISNYSIVIVNGRMTRQGFVGRVASYEITPTSAGVFRAGPVSAAIDGRTLTDPGPEITVAGVTPQDEVRILVESSRANVLVDEPFEIRLRLRIRALTGNYAGVEPLFPNSPPTLNAPFLGNQPIDGLKGPDIPVLLRNNLAQRSNQPGMAINDYKLANDPFGFHGFGLFDDFFGQPRSAKFALPRRMVEIDGKKYHEYWLDLQYTPEAEGNYVFGPVTFKGSVPTAVDARGNAQSRDVFAVGHACTVRVVPPPEAGRPDSFTGALGTNMQVTAALDCLSCNAGDPVRLTLTATGDVRFDRMLPVKLSLQTNLLDKFSVYDQTVQTLDDGLRQRRFVYTIRPRYAGLIELPSIEVTYFDTTRREYVICATDPVPLEVRPGREITADQIVGVTASADKAEADIPDAELLPAPIKPGSRRLANENLSGSRALWMIIVSGPIFFMLVTAVQEWRLRRQRGAVARRRRTMRARTQCRLRKLADKTSMVPDTAAAEICGIIRDCLSAQFDNSALAMTPDDLRQLTKRTNLTESTACQLVEIYRRNFNAVYNHSRAADPEGVACDCGELKRIIDSLHVS